ncbi:VOC family protein [Kitasatospora nipponensis]|uniref:VOC family protein n=1 Tax=Kitasatospora nipponensis TaxID=258049 RepID=A0ABN1WU07_9ACTN
MSKITAYREGVPCWVDLTAADPVRAAAFYGSLFGWEFTEIGADGGHYRLATLRGVRVAGIAPQQPGEESGPAAVWNTYLAAEDVDRTVAKVRDAGGGVLVEPVEVLDFGRMAVVVDPAGAVVGLWQGRTHGGSGLANEPGAFTWNENLSTDPRVARGFYQQVFGYTYDDVAGMDYSVFKVAGAMAGGIGGQPSMIPPGTTSFWSVYFAVTDTDLKAAQVVDLGGRILVPPADTPYGRMSVVRDDAGAAFCLIAPPRG